MTRRRVARWQVALAHMGARGRWVAAAALLGAGASSRSPFRLARDEAGVAAQLAFATGLAVAPSDYVWAPSRGALGDLLLGRPVYFLGRANQTSQRDLYRAWGRCTRAGVVLGVGRAEQLTRTPHADEAALDARGERLAVRVDVEGRTHGFVVLEGRATERLDVALDRPTTDLAFELHDDSLVFEHEGEPRYVPLRDATCVGAEVVSAVRRCAPSPVDAVAPPSLLGEVTPADGFPPPAAGVVWRAALEPLPGRPAPIAVGQLGEAVLHAIDLRQLEAELALGREQRGPSDLTLGHPLPQAVALAALQPVSVERAGRMHSFAPGTPSQWVVEEGGGLALGPSLETSRARFSFAPLDLEAARSAFCWLGGHLVHVQAPARVAEVAARLGCTDAVGASAVPGFTVGASGWGEPPSAGLGLERTAVAFRPRVPAPTGDGWTVEPRQPPPAWLPSVFSSVEERAGARVELWKWAPGRVVGALEAGSDEHGPGVLPLPSSPELVFELGLGVARRKGLGLVVRGKVVVRPKGGAMLALSAEDALEVREGEVPPPLTSFAELPLLATDGKLTSAARLVGRERPRAGLCVAPDGAVLVAYAVADSFEPLTEALTLRGCAVVVAADRGTGAPAWWSTPASSGGIRDPGASRLVLRARPPRIPGARVQSPLAP